jgi:hypothetical protein
MLGRNEQSCTLFRIDFDCRFVILRPASLLISILAAITELPLTQYFD